MSGLPECLKSLAADINVESLTPDRRAAFDNLVAAAIKSEAAEETVKAAQQRLHVAFNAAAEARKRLPKVTAIDAARSWIDTQKAVAEGRL